MHLQARWVCAAVACVLSVAASPAASQISSRAQGFRVEIFRFVDHSRTIRLQGGRRVPRPLKTIVDFPATGGPYPLIVFGHGFGLTPETYQRLLLAWTQAGYVVAAPWFPLENADAPGGPNESDLVNQPRDVAFVISRLIALTARPGDVLERAIDPSQTAVAGHSDGGVTALAVAYDRRFRDPRVRAAIVLSGAALAGLGPFARTGPPLLAVQGTADTINRPETTASFFRLVRRPKFLLWLLGAGHLPPYTVQEPQLGIVERATVAFLNHYLKGQPLPAFKKAAQRPRITRLIADP
jgi:pimeloyl-ACP methyl ester carboxylesterase